MSSQTQSAANPSPLRVGFDLDGVLFFNPFRVLRAPVEWVKKCMGKDTRSFYIPHSPLEKIIWRIVHLSSLHPAQGWQSIRTLSEQKRIVPYLITARFSCLSADFKRCKRTLQADNYFAQCYQNSNDEQPHLFKERMIKQLGIEVYVEDNWNIVDHLSKHTAARILWIGNSLDAHIHYPETYPDLESALARVTQLAAA